LQFKNHQQLCITINSACFNVSHYTLQPTSIPNSTQTEHQECQIVQVTTTSGFGLPRNLPIPGEISHQQPTTPIDSGLAQVAPPQLCVLAVSESPGLAGPREHLALAAVCTQTASAAAAAIALPGQVTTAALLRCRPAPRTGSALRRPAIQTRVLPCQPCTPPTGVRGACD
jgi:hypothetical protein